MAKLPAIISVHDVMPDTLERVIDILNSELVAIDAKNVVLLVVPGLEWTDSQIAMLASLQRTGYELAGHGWLHEATQVEGLYHRLHRRLISRNAAEHLSMTKMQLKALLVNNYQWFERHGMSAPSLYVPPAWAMGRLSKRDLKQLPFQSYESTSGLFFCETSQYKWLPLVGFEADTRLRAKALCFWNYVNCFLSSRRRPVRISIHPFDTDLYLASNLSALIARSKAVNWRDVFHAAFTSSVQK